MSVLFISSKLSTICGQLKLYAADGKKYLSDLINEDGVKMLLSIIPSRYKKAIQDWVKGLLDPIDEQSKKKAYDFYNTDLIEEDEIGKAVVLRKMFLHMLLSLAVPQL